MWQTAGKAPEALPNMDAHQFLQVTTAHRPLMNKLGLGDVAVMNGWVYQPQHCSAHEGIQQSAQTLEGIQLMQILYNSGHGLNHQFLLVSWTLRRCRRRDSGERVTFW